MKDQIKENLAELEAFLLDIEILDQLESRLNVFNLFETLDIHRTEIRHSNVIAWLMKPLENHGLGDIFLRKFLQHTYLGNKMQLDKFNFSMLELATIEYSDFQVYREWHNIDILAISDDNKIVIVLENKVGSKESEHQLKKYLTKVEQEFPDYKKLFMFLTPDGDIPSDTENWIVVTYNQILDVLLKAMDLKKSALDTRVIDFLNQYIETVRRYVMREHDLEKLCREIYYKHQKALDLIFEYKPDVFLEVSEYAAELVASNNDIIMDICTKTYVRFIPKPVDEILPLEGNWTKTKRILLWEIQNRDNRVIIKLIIGPGPSQIRNNLFNIAQNHEDIFKGRLRNITDSYTQIYKTELLSKNFHEKMDIEQIKETLSKRIEKFFLEDYIKITDIIVDEFSYTY
ncbi:PD-(D/E)XK nuclease family protein [Peribacillus sp. NPDC097675]|uniref:PDDEXK-like family protein n=1 Tax=Peribacillus sp. NPDC097675 TaxID=3390618 RepID=UPI003CFCC345